MSMHSFLRPGAGLAAIAVLAAACGGTTGSASSSGSTKSSTPSSTASSTPAPSSTASATETPAATLRANLDFLLRQHVDLTGFLVQTAVGTSLTSPQTQAASKTLDANTQALGAAVGQLYGPAAQADFLKMWRAHIGYFVTYTQGLATHNPAMVSRAQTELQGYTSQFSQFISTATKLPASAVSADLQGHVQTLEAAIQAIVTKSPDAGVKLEMAAAHMDGTAAVLAQGFATSKHLAGNPNSTASSLRAALTGLLVQHVAATTVVVQTAAQDGLSSPQTAGAIQALTNNTNHLGAAIGSIYGSAAQQSFLKQWNAHIGFFVNYTKGVATHDTALQSQANTQLQGYVSQFAQFLSGATKGGLPTAAVAADLQGHVQTLEAAINQIVPDSATASSSVSMAEQHMVGTAAVLAKGFATQFPSKFTNN